MTRGNGWTPYEDALDRGPWPIFWKVVVFLVLAGAVLGAVRFCANQAATTAQVASEQYSARALLQKYEWFKDARAGLDAKRASLSSYEGRLTRLTRDYGADHATWPRDVREQAAIWEDEYTGLIASYNELAGQYNAQMAKFNYRFTNRGTLPAGTPADSVLPREFATYIYGGSAR